MKNPGRDRYIISTVKSWNITAAKQFISENPDTKVLLVTDRNDLTYQKVRKFNPRYIFFPHWSWIIPQQIYENFECVVFHMTDLPFGRGGSPLQNLIARGIYKTKISAIKVVGEVDAGPVYLKRDLDLKGSATEIFKRVSNIIFEDIIYHIICNRPAPIPQEGTVVSFARRTPEQSDITNLKSSIKVYDYIRMLDAEGYPLAFVETPTLKIEFFDAELQNDHVLVQGKIEIKNEHKNSCDSGPS